MEKALLRNEYHGYPVERLFATALFAKAPPVNSVKEYFKFCPKYLPLQTCLQKEFLCGGLRTGKHDGSHVGCKPTNALVTIEWCGKDYKNYKGTNSGLKFFRRKLPAWINFHDFTTRVSWCLLSVWQVPCASVSSIIWSTARAALVRLQKKRLP